MDLVVPNSPNVVALEQRYAELFPKVNAFGDAQKAVEYGKELYEIALLIGDKERLAKAHLVYGLASVHNNDLAGLNHYREAIRLGDELERYGISIPARYNLANAIGYQGSPDEALALLQEAVELAKRCCPPQLIICYVNLAVLLDELGRYRESFECTYQGYKLALVSNDDFALGAIERRLGKSLGLAGECDRALRFAESAVQRFESINNPRETIVSLADLCEIQTIIADYRGAECSIRSAKKLDRSIHSSQAMANVLLSEARLRLKQGEYKKVFEVLDELIERDPELAEVGRAPVSLIRGEALLRLGRLKPAEEILREIYQVGCQTNTKQIIFDAASLLAQLYEQSGQPAEALKYYKMQAAIAPFRQGMSIKRQLELVEAQRNLERKEDEVQRERERTRSLEEQLSLHTVSLASQTELLANFRDELRKIIRDIDEPMEALRKIKDRLKALPCEQIDWLKFEEQFRAVHPEFRAKLVEKYPQLTPQEVRICQLLRVGMKSHEIARLICISERGVETHRLNIRKKLALTSEQTLPEFLGKLM